MLTSYVFLHKIGVGTWVQIRNLNEFFGPNKEARTGARKRLLWIEKSV